MAIGLTLDDVASPPVELWPENEQAVNVFLTLGTQWRFSGAGGPVGLDYNVLFTRLNRMPLADAAYEELFEDIRILESEALKVMTERHQPS